MAEVKAEPWHLTAEEIAPHQVPVTSVEFIREYGAITGDRWREYRAPDGEVIEIRVSCGAYAPDDTPVWGDEQARPAAIEQVNRKRQGRAERITQGLPVTARLKATGE